MRDDGLLDNEGQVMDHITAAWVAFAELPAQHPDETQDFLDAVHRCQDILACRIARRLYPKGWPTYTDE